MFVKLSIVIVVLAMAKLAEGTPTCAEITSMSTVIKKALTGNTTTGNLASKALRLGINSNLSNHNHKPLKLLFMLTCNSAILR